MSENKGAPSLGFDLYPNDSVKTRLVRVMSKDGRAAKKAEHRITPYTRTKCRTPACSKYAVTHYDGHCKTCYKNANESAAVGVAHNKQNTIEKLLIDKIPDGARSGDYLQLYNFRKESKGFVAFAELVNIHNGFYDGVAKAITDYRQEIVQRRIEMSRAENKK